MYSCHLFSISSASFRSIPFLSFIVPILAWNVPLVSLISYLSLLFFGTQHSDAYIFPFLLCLSLLFFFQLFRRPLQTTVLPFCRSLSWGWFWSLPPIRCYEPLFIVPQALCLSDRIPWVYLSLPLCNHKGFDLGQTWMAYWLSLLSSI